MSFKSKLKSWTFWIFVVLPALLFICWVVLLSVIAGAVLGKFPAAYAKALPYCFLAVNAAFVLLLLSGEFYRLFKLDKTKKTLICVAVLALVALAFVGCQIRAALLTNDLSESLIKSDELFRVYSGLVERNEPSQAAFDAYRNAFDASTSLFLSFFLWTACSLAVSVGVSDVIKYVSERQKPDKKKNEVLL